MIFQFSSLHNFLSAKNLSNKKVRYYLSDESGDEFEVEVVDDVDLTVKVVPDF